MTRPAQEISIMTAAFEAAKEVNASTLASEQYRQANYFYAKAQVAYRQKYYDVAIRYASQATALAEEAELKALEKGAVRKPIVETNLFEEAAAAKEPPAKPTAPSAEFAGPQEIPADGYDKRIEQLKEATKKDGK